MINIYDYLYVPEESREVSISRNELDFICKFLEQEKNNINKTLEIGMAHGFSTAAIISSTLKPHVAIDPYQSVAYNNIGINNIAKLGLTPLLHHEPETSHIALPRMLFQEEKFQFIFIDGDHKFDFAFLDFYYSDLLLGHNGHILFHDYKMPAIQRLDNWIMNNKKYYICKQTTDNMLLIQKTGYDQRKWDDYNQF